MPGTKRKSPGGSYTTPRKRRKPISARQLFKSRSKARVTTVVRAPGPVPPRTICKMKYADQYTTNGSTIDHLWNLNSTFNPNRTGIGHQPYGRDTYANLYNRYRVFAVTYNITFASPAAGTHGYAMIGWDNTAVARTNPTLWYETPKSRIKVLTDEKPAIFRGRISLPAVTGVTKEQYRTDDRFQSVNTTDPAEQIILHTGAVGLDSSTLPANSVYIKVELTYHVEWFDQFTLGQS